MRLVAVPDGVVRAENFGTFDTEVGAPRSEQVLVGLRRLGLNAGLVHRLGREGTAYGPGIDVGDVPASDAVVEVLESGVEEFQPGDLAVGTVPWCTSVVIDADELRKIDKAVPSEGLVLYLTVLGHVGFTAYTGLIYVGDVQPDDVVYVSGAAGGVGSCVVQFAKARGVTVMGVAGSQDKVALLTDVLGADRAINRHDGAAVDLLRDAAPEGIDLYYDNVGGEQLEAALEVLNFGGRAVICGAVADASDSGAPTNYRRLIYQELTLRGFTVTAHEDLRDQFESEVGGWVREGKVRSLHTVFDGIDRVPEAFESVLTGGSSGRVIVAVSSQQAGR